MSDYNFVVKNGLQVNSALVANSSGLYLSNSLFINATSFVGTSNNSQNLAGLPASTFQTTLGLAANVLTQTANNTLFVGSTPSALIVNTSQLNLGLNTAYSNAVSDTLVKVSNTYVSNTYLFSQLSVKIDANNGVINNSINFFGANGNINWGNQYIASNGTNIQVGNGSGNIYLAANNILLNGAIPLTSNNYQNYSPTLSGSGATGSWNINVSGSSNSANIAKSIAWSDGGANLSFQRNPGGATVPTYVLGNISFVNGVDTVSYYNVNQMNVNNAVNLTGGGISRTTYNYTSNNIYAVAGDGLVANISSISGSLNSYGSLTVVSANSSTPAYMTFLRQGAYAIGLGIDTDNQFKIGGWSASGQSYTLLHSGNFNTYSPSLSGQGATGNWNINISGKAAAASTANVIASSDNSAQFTFNIDVDTTTNPPYVWGSNDGYNYYRTRSGSLTTYKSNYADALSIYTGPSSAGGGHFYQYIRQPGQTGYLWGTNGGTVDTYSYDPANFNVNSAVIATSLAITRSSNNQFLANAAFFGDYNPPSTNPVRLWGTAGAYNSYLFDPQFLNVNSSIYSTYSSYLTATDIPGRNYSFNLNSPSSPAISPQLIWGTNDQQNFYQYNPLNFNVNSAVSLSGSLTANQVTTGLGFIPIQQGGGAGQQNKKVNIGWNGSGLSLSVDGVSYGATWPINVTGSSSGGVATSSAVANSLNIANAGISNFSYTAQASQPTGLWGTNSGTLSYIYNPANFNVNSAINASQLGGISSNSYALISSIIPNANNATYLNGNPASSFAMVNGTVNNAINANNASNLGGIAASQYAYANSISSNALYASSANNAAYLNGISGSSYLLASSANTLSVNVAHSVNFTDYPAGPYYITFNSNTVYAQPSTVWGTYNGVDFSRYRVESFSVNNSVYLGGVAASQYAVVSNTTSTSLGVGTGSSGVTGRIVATENIISYYSDKRLKTDIKLIENALDKVNSISGVTYIPSETAIKLGYSDMTRQVGVLSQELEAVLPEVVQPAPFDTEYHKQGNYTLTKSISGENYKTVQYERIVPLLIEAIKELTIKVEKLEKVK